MSDRLTAALAELADAIRAEIEANSEAADAPDRLLSITEAADALGLGRSLVYGEIGSGRLGSVKVGRRRLIPSSYLAEFIAAAQSPPGAGE